MKRILIIDDEEDLCVLMRAYLQPLQFDVHLAFTLRDGLQKARELSPDILFLDNNLPDGLGWDTVGQLRTLLPQSKINLMSAFTHLPQELENIPSVRFLEKPISLSTLRSFL
jgi:DNA-binding response OmpR family regulator